LGFRVQGLGIGSGFTISRDMGSGFMISRFWIKESWYWIQGLCFAVHGSYGLECNPLSRVSDLALMINAPGLFDQGSQGHRLCWWRRRIDDGRVVGGAGAGCALCGMDVEGLAQHECWARCLPWMRAERWPLRCIRRHAQWRVQPRPYARH
jgi:hypothetical protein